ncbi:hypothetical protein Hanom_Chr00s004999g01727391 [Helianthus anomalus]
MKFTAFNVYLLYNILLYKNQPNFPSHAFSLVKHITNLTHSLSFVNQFVLNKISSHAFSFIKHGKLKRHIPFPLWIDVYLTQSNSKTNQLLPTFHFSANVFLYPNNRLLASFYATIWKTPFPSMIIAFQVKVGQDAVYSYSYPS